MDAVIGTQNGESFQVELTDQQAQALTGMHIGDDIEGSLVGLDGYTLRITGGSDTEGFPMRRSVDGTGRKRLLVNGGTGARDLEDGERTRTSVRGNTVSSQIAQVNLAVVEPGDEDVATLLGEEPAEASGDEAVSEADDAGDDEDETGDATGDEEA
ncbi:MAG: 30S ribosomal protein S6e [Candidatus Nanohaloarchaea archaeon]|nr:30S ribosomal protein S6e [Candidatus Nanohaloarchaea archaeon]